MKKRPFINLISTFLLAGAVRAAEFYVAPSGSHVPPFRSQETAATNLQAAVERADSGDLILVAPGVYGQDPRVIRIGGALNRLVLDKELTVKSLAGPDATVIDAGGNGRCVYVSRGAELAGFTLRNGRTGAGECGAGVLAEPDGRVTDCVITNCVSGEEGGGIYGGTATRCRLVDNLAYAGGAAADSQLDSCLLWKNRAKSVGGGAAASALNFCTVVENTALRSGGGTYHCRVSNSIIRYNVCSGPGRNYFFGTMQKSCTRPRPTWALHNGNIEDDPRFLDRASGNFRLTLLSPCIDQAERGMVASDLAGRPRSLDGDNSGTCQADMGAYEYLHPSADSDGDGTSDYAQFQTGDR